MMFSETNFFIYLSFVQIPCNFTFQHAITLNPIKIFAFVICLNSLNFFFPQTSNQFLAAHSTSRTKSKLLTTQNEQRKKSETLHFNYNSSIQEQRRVEVQKIFACVSHLLNRVRKLHETDKICNECETTHSLCYAPPRGMDVF